MDTCSLASNLPELQGPPRGPRRVNIPVHVAGMGLVRTSFPSLKSVDGAHVCLVWSLPFGGDSLQKGIIKIKLTAATTDAICQILFQGLWEISIVTIIPILQMREVGFREVKCLA